jgi:hypothetical protein
MDDTVQYIAVIKLEKITTKVPERATSPNPNPRPSRVSESTSVTVRSGSLDGLKKKLETIMTVLDHQYFSEGNR